MADLAKTTTMSKTELATALAKRSAADARRAVRDRLAAKRTMGLAVRAGTGSAAAFGGNFLIARNPRLASIDKGGKVPTDPLIAFAALGGAFFLDGLAADALEGVAMGRGMVYVGALGTRAGTKTGG